MILSQLSNFQQRLIISSIGILILFIIVYFSQHPLFRPLFTFFVASVIGCALWEYYRIAKAKGFVPLVRLGITASILYLVVLFLSIEKLLDPIAPHIVLALSLLTFSCFYLFKDNDLRDHTPLVNLAVTVFGMIYITLPLSLTININFFFDSLSFQDGRWWLLYLLAVTKMTDTGAYFIGKKFGTKKLAPHLSPKKTVEGAFGGLLASIITSYLFYWLSTHYPDSVRLDLTLASSLSLGFAVGVLAQIGDLVESLLKRDAGVKDSNQLPGLGGIFDIVDSLIFTTPLIYFFLKLE